jgi:hypothetical protein
MRLRDSKRLSNLSDQSLWDRGIGHDGETRGRHVITLGAGMAHEHGCYAVDSCAAVLSDRGGGFFDVEDSAHEL